jgi:Mycobacterial 4 TMS phage holin, superfamily IV
VVLDGDGHTLRFCSFGVSLGRARIFLGHWLITAVALAVSARMVPGIYVGSWAVLLVAALVLGLANAVVRQNRIEGHERLQRGRDIQATRGRAALRPVLR